LSKPLRVWLTVGIALTCIGVIGLYSPIALMAIGLVLIALGTFWGQITKVKYFGWLLLAEKIFNKPPNDPNKNNCQSNVNNSYSFRPHINNGSDNKDYNSSTSNPFPHNIPPKNESHWCTIIRDVKIVAYLRRLFKMPTYRKIYFLPFTEPLSVRPFGIDEFRGSRLLRWFPYFTGADIHLLLSIKNLPKSKFTTDELEY